MKKTDMSNAVQEFLCDMTITSELHFKAILTRMNYCIGPTNQGFLLKPKRNGMEETRHVN